MAGTTTVDNMAWQLYTTHITNTGALFASYARPSAMDTDTFGLSSFVNSGQMTVNVNDEQWELSFSNTGTVNVCDMLETSFSVD